MFCSCCLVLIVFLPLGQFWSFWPFRVVEFSWLISEICDISAMTASASDLCAVRNIIATCSIFVRSQAPNPWVCLNHFVQMMRQLPIGSMLYCHAFKTSANRTDLSASQLDTRMRCRCLNFLVPQRLNICMYAMPFILKVHKGYIVFKQIVIVFDFI